MTLSLLLSLLPAMAGAPLSLEVTGACPGTIFVDVQGASPGATLALVWSLGPGNALVPGGVCAGTPLGLAAPPHLLDVVTADAFGEFSLSATPPATRCSAFLQVVELGSCRVAEIRPVTPVPNTPPQISQVSLAPADPRVADTLVASTTVSDADGDPVSLTHAWYVNGVLYALGAGNTFAVGAAAQKGDTIHVRVTPTDGTDLGTPMDSEQVVVANTPPSLSSVSISPADPEVGETLTCSALGFSDADGDANQSVFTWTVGGLTVGQGATLSSGFSGGDTVRCTVDPFDGEEYGAERFAEVAVAAEPGPIGGRPVGWQNNCAAYGSSVQLVTGSVSFYFPFSLSSPRTLTAVGFETAIGSTVGVSVHAAVFTNSGGAPGTRLVQGTGTFTVGGATTAHEIDLADTSLAAGSYWIGIAANGGTFIPTCNTLGTESFFYTQGSVGTSYSFPNPAGAVGPFNSSANGWGVAFLYPIGL
jgi:hypothetical protein